MTNLTVFLQAAGGSDMMMTVLMFGAMFLVMYFFMIRPQMQRQKKEKKFQEDLKVGQRVVTSSGIHGKISEVTDNVVTLETGAGKIRFEKSAISNDMTASRYGDKNEKTVAKK